MWKLRLVGRGYGRCLGEPDAFICRNYASKTSLRASNPWIPSVCALGLTLLELHLLTGAGGTHGRVGSLRAFLQGYHMERKSIALACCVQCLPYFASRMPISDVSTLPPCDPAGLCLLGAAADAGEKAHFASHYTLLPSRLLTAASSSVRGRQGGITGKCLCSCPDHGTSHLHGRALEGLWKADSCRQSA